MGSLKYIPAKHGYKWDSIKNGYRGKSKNCLAKI